MRRAWLVFVLATLAAPGCGDDGGVYCDHDRCYCTEGHDCELFCGAPPCSVECNGEDTTCVAECGNGSCDCGEGASCELECHSPPCHVSCDRDTVCTGTCANGTCRCARGAACSFECQSGPCHVQCAGDHPACDGTCENGTCACGPNSSCNFRCLDDNCSATCAAGSSCVLECATGRAGEQGCDFRSCAAGTPTVCPGGTAITCNAPCP